MSKSTQTVLPEITVANIIAARDALEAHSVTQCLANARGDDVDVSIGQQRLIIACSEARKTIASKTARDAHDAYEQFQKSLSDGQREEVRRNSFHNKGKLAQENNRLRVAMVNAAPPIKRKAVQQCLARALALPETKVNVSDITRLAKSDYNRNSPDGKRLQKANSNAFYTAPIELQNAYQKIVDAYQGVIPENREQEFKALAKCINAAPVELRRVVNEMIWSCLV